MDVNGSLKCSDFRLSTAINNAVIYKLLFAYSGNVSLGALNTGQIYDYEMTVTGVATDGLYFILPNVVPDTASLLSDVVITAFVSDTDKIKVKFFNPSATDYSGEEVEIRALIVKADTQ